MAAEDSTPQPETESPARPDPTAGPTAVQSLGAMWLYSVLRFGLFFVLWGVLYLCRVETFLAALIALVLSIPLSYILLRRQRQKMADNLQWRVEARRGKERNLDDRLSGEE